MPDKFEETARQLLEEISRQREENNRKWRAIDDQLEATAHGLEDALAVREARQHA